MIRNHKYLLVFLPIYCLVWAACTQQRKPCLTPKIAGLTIESMHFTTDTSTVFVDTALVTAEFVPLTNSALVGLLFPQGSAFTISLSPDTISCKWLFRTDTTIATFDTLTFYYKKQLQFLSNACGYTYFYVLDTVTTTHYSLQTPQYAIDSVHITNPGVTNNANATKNIQVFIHPDF